MPLTLASNAITFTDNTSLSSAIITNPLLSANSVSTDKIVNGAVTFAKISQNSGAFSFRNKIINGNFDIWQRNTSFTNLISNRYLADRWKHFFDGTGATRTITRQPFTQGQTDVPNEPTYFLRYQLVTAGNDTFYTLDQPIEDVRTFAGKQITFSFWARANTNITLSHINYYQVFGDGGSPQVFAAFATNVPITTTWQKYTYTSTVPSIANKIIGSNHYLGIRWLFPPTTICTIDIAQVQLEEGPVATPFEQRPIGLELSLCQRYYCKSYQLNQLPGYAEHDQGVVFIGNGSAFVDYNTTVVRSFNGYVQFPVEMRSVPTVQLYDSNGGIAGRVGFPDRAETTCFRNFYGPSRVNTRGFCEITGNLGGTSTNAGLAAWPADGQAASFQYTADAEL